MNLKENIKKVLKEETNKFELVKNFIYTMYDNVRVVEYIAKRNEVMVYYTNHDNRQMLIPTEICELISNYTGLDVVPYYEYDKNIENGKFKPDFYLDTEEYEEDLNENYNFENKETSKETEKNLKSIRTILSQVSWEGLCDISVEYCKEDNDYEIRSKSIKRDKNSDDTDIIDELTNLGNILRSMGVKVSFFAPLGVDSCEDDMEFINENYSPAGKEITPNKIVIHKSNPKFRDRISNEGLKASAGECYKIYAGYGEKCIPAIFATNSINKRAWFDSTYDDDVWAINTELIPNVKWYKDRHFESSKKHIVTFDNIPSEAIELMREGTGKDLMGESSENKDMTNDIEKNLKAIRMLLKQVSWEGLCDIWVEYNPVDKDYEIRSKSIQRHFDHDEIVKELNYIDNTLRSMGLIIYVFTPWYVDNCEDEVKFMDENINESKQESQKEMIENVLNNIILPEYDHVICGFEVKEPNERFDTLHKSPFKFVSVTVTFIGGHGTKLFPQTQGVKQMYDDVLDEIWDVIYNYTNEAVDVFYKTTNDCGKKNIYLKESNNKNKTFLKDKFGIDFDGKIKMIQNFEELPSMFRVYFFPKDFNRMLNNGGPFYVINSDKGYKIGNKYVNKYYLYRPRVDGSSYLIDQDGYNKAESTFLENLGIDIIGLTIKDLIDMYFEESINEYKDNYK